jgi:hypothetical protein
MCRPAALRTYKVCRSVGRSVNCNPPCQHSHFWFHALRDPRPHFSVSRLEKYGLSTLRLYRVRSDVTNIMNDELCRIWGSNSGGYKDSYLRGYNAVHSVESQPTYGRSMPPPSSGLTNKPSSACHLFSCVAYSDPEDGGAPSKRRLTFNGTTRRYIPEYRTLGKNLME